MAESENLLDFSPAPPAVRSVTNVSVPRYSLYGDPSLQRGWVLNLESLDHRARGTNWAIEPHVHPKFTQLVFVASGGGTMTIDGDEMPFEAPSVLVVPIFHVHGFEYREPAQGMVLTLEDTYLGELLARAAELKPILRNGGAFPLSVTAWQVIEGALAALGNELRDAHPGQMIAADIQLLQILLAMLRDRPVHDDAGTSGRAEVVERFLAVVEQRFRDQPSLGELAGALGLTEGQLRLACRSATGMAPLAIVHDRILAEAKRCLAYSAMSVAEIAWSLGFDDAAYFSRFFAKKIGRSPMQFRRSKGTSS